MSLRPKSMERAAKPKSNPLPPAKAVPQHLMDKLRAVREVMNSRILERTNETDGILLTLLSGLSCLFLGDVGTAKTSHIRLASEMFGLSTFDILLSETTKPDHIFGPTDIPALAQGRQVTKTEGYAPSSEVLFFDEIFKANAVVLNPLLWLVNEHKYRNGDAGVMQCPIFAVFAASNEIPTDPVLRAVYDRFTLRFEVQYLKDHMNQRKMVRNFLAGADPVQATLTREEVLELRELVKTVEVPDEVVVAVLKIRDQVQTACAFSISDRRVNTVFRLIQAKAVLSGRLRADVGDVEVTANVFWDKPDQQVKVQAISLSHSNADITDIMSYNEIADSVMETALRSGNLIDAKKKLRRLYDAVRKFNTSSGKLVARQIRSKLQHVRMIIEQRKNFVLVKIVTSNKTWYKLSQASATVWTTKQLRDCGFHNRRSGGYWYYEGSLKTLLNSVQSKLRVEPVIRSIEADVSVRMKK